MIDPTLNPLHTPWTPGPHLRGDIVEHTPTGGFGHPGEMKVQPGIVDQYDKIPGLCLEHPSNRAHALDHRSDSRQPDQSHHIQLRDTRDKADSGSPHPRPTNAHQLSRRVERHDRFGQMRPVEITGGFACDNQNSHDLLWEELGEKSPRLYPAVPLSRYPVIPRPSTISLSPAIPYFMANRKGLNGLQDLVRETHCRRAVLTRYHGPCTRAGCVKKRFKLKLQWFFISTL